jgi:hypothetical protein
MFFSDKLRKVLLGFALAWGVFAFLRETGHTLSDLDNREETKDAVEDWRPGTPPVARLDRCLDLVRQRVPPGHVVVFASSADDVGGPESEFFRWRWAAYLLPQYDVAPLHGADTGKLAEYLITFDRPLDNPRLETLAEIPGCRLSRVRKGAA